MAKYNYEFKKKVVLAYLKGEGGYGYLSVKYGIKSHSNIEKWVALYKKFDDKGLICSCKNSIYTFQFKFHVVELYLSNKVSYQELALSQGINNPALIARWVNDYRNFGPDALRPKKRGRKKTLDKNNSKKISKTIEEKTTDTNAEYLKELEEENLKLRIENAYLKESRRLRLEEEALLKKQRESSTVSGDNSN